MRGNSGPNRSDADLVAAVRSGDTGAFADLYAEHVESVRRVAAHVVGEAEGVADAVQDSFARALQHLDDLREPDRFRPWLLSIVRHAATDQLRARRRLTPLDASHDELLASTRLGPESLAEGRELADHVQGCVAGLSRRLRNALALRLMVQQPSLACEEFQRLRPTDLLRAANHVAQCEVCLVRAGAEVVRGGLSGVPA